MSHFVSPACQAQIIAACAPYRAELAQMRKQRDIGLKSFLERQSRNVEAVPDLKPHGKAAILLQAFASPASPHAMKNVLVRAEFKARDRRFSGESITGFGEL